MGAFDWFWKAMGSGASRNQKRSIAITEAAAQRAEELAQLGREELNERARTALAGGELKDPAEFLAVLGEASRRTLGMSPFKVQSQAVLRLLEGDVVHMATGEGKTLVGAMAATGFGLMGKRVHVITVNDYLAARDAEWMSPLVEFFGVSVGAITSSPGASSAVRALDSASDAPAHTTTCVSGSISRP